MKICESCGEELGPDSMAFCTSCGYRVAGADLAVTGILVVPDSAYLEFLGGPEDGRVIQLGPERVTVGRRDDNDVHIYSDTALSRRHAFIEKKEGQFWIEDRGSSFGTWVAGKRVPVETAATARAMNMGAEQLAEAEP